MKKLLFSTPFLIVSLSLSAGSFSADFEDQDLSKWMPFEKDQTVSVSSENPGNGKYSLVTLPAGMKLKKAARIPVTQGQKYQISAKMRTKSGKLRMSIVEYDKAGDWIKGTTFYAAETRSTEWVTLQNVWSPKNANTAFAVIQFDGGDGFADDIKFGKLEEK